MLVLVFVAAAIGATGEAEVFAPVVPAYERFHAGPDAPARSDARHKSQAERAAGGRLLLSELGCTACHAPSEVASAWIERKAAPDLSSVATRVKPAWLKAYIAAPLATHPGATMPDLLHGYDKERRREIAAALADYLTSLSPQAPPAQRAPIGGRQRGAELFAKIGCAVCHGEREGRDEEGQKASLAAWRLLGDLDAKYTFAGLTGFLRDPLACRPAGRMPSFSLSVDEANDLAAHLLPQTPELEGIAYKYFEGSWERIPPLDDLAPVASGSVTTIDVSPRRRDDHFALRFEALLKIAVEGEYTFHLGSDDGSRLSIDGRRIVNQNRVQGFTWRSSKARLEAGEHQLRVDYFEQQGEERLEIEWEGPGFARRPLAADLLAQSQATEPLATPLEEAAVEVDVALAARGKELFASLGCAACHAIEQPGGAPIASALAAPKLQVVNIARGCLSKTLKGTAPNYALTSSQRADLVAAITALNDARATTPSTPERIDAEMERRFCYACHERSGKGLTYYGVPSVFTGTQPEMGHEGVVPPALDGVGAKLTSKWLRQTLAHGAKDRPYMATRMPGFGEAVAERIAVMFETHDWTPPIVAAKDDTPLTDEELGEYKLAGWMMVGESGFSCVKCHTFGRFRSTGVQSIDMTTMSKRLRRDWFLRYVDNPMAFRQQTRMPDAWPKADGTSLLKNVLDGKNATQIRAVWEYLADGERARTPTGVAGGRLELVPIAEAIIYRNFIEGVGPRGIAVGFPEHVHFAFDAGDCRLALLWQGAFIDASLHWTGRGAGAQQPAGEKIVALPFGPTFAVLADERAAWPLGETRFRGYRLSAENRPTFLYDCGKVRIEDAPGPASGGGEEATLARRYQVARREDAAKVAGMWMRIAAGNEISIDADGWCDVDGRYRTRVAGLNARLRSVDTGQEWIAPIDVDEERSFTQEYRW